MSTYQTTFSIKRLWIILSVGMVVMFGILLLLGREIYQQAPPMPQLVKSASGEACIRLMILKPVRISGSPSVACNRVRSGVTAAILHRTGVPIGCTARRKHCWQY